MARNLVTAYLLKEIINFRCAINWITLFNFSPLNERAHELLHNYDNNRVTSHLRIGRTLIVWRKLKILERGFYLFGKMIFNELYVMWMLVEIQYFSSLWTAQRTFEIFTVVNNNSTVNNNQTQTSLLKFPAIWKNYCTPEMLRVAFGP